MPSESLFHNHDDQPDDHDAPGPQNVTRALANLERILYAIPQDGTELRLRFHNGVIERMVDDGYSQGPRWEPLPLDYGQSEVDLFGLPRGEWNDCLGPD